MFQRTITLCFCFLGAGAAALTACFLSPVLCAAPGTAESKARQPRGPVQGQRSVQARGPGGAVGRVGAMGSIPGSQRTLEKKMTTHASILAWEIPWTEEPGRLLSIGMILLNCGFGEDS